MLTVKELPKRGTYLLVLSLSASSAEDLAATVPEVQAAVAEWRARRRAKCEAVILAVQAVPELDAALRSVLDDAQKGGLGQASSGVPVSVAFAHKGNTYRQYFLGGSNSSVPTRPWWRFW